MTITHSTDMFSVPQPSQTTNEPDRLIKSVKLSEPSSTIHPLLSLIYPIPYEIPSEFTLVILCDLLHASEKYDMKTAQSKIVHRILAIVNKDESKAMQAFAIGSSLQIQELIAGASKASLKCRPEQIFEFNPAHRDQSQFSRAELSTAKAILLQMTAWDYFRLAGLYNYRLNKIKGLIKSHGVRLPTRWIQRERNDYPARCNCINGDASITDIAARFVMMASAEVDRAGPLTQEIFTIDFIKKCYENYCEFCCKRVFIVRYDDGRGGDFFRILDQLKSEIDSLPAEIGQDVSHS